MVWKWGRTADDGCGRRVRVVAGGMAMPGIVLAPVAMVATPAGVTGG